MKNYDKNSASKKNRIQLAISEIMNGYLLLEEAVVKYEVPASSIIQGLRKIQKLKKDAAQSSQQGIQITPIQPEKHKNK
jgi:hypothetical protein